MKTKQLKVRKPDGTVEYIETMDMEGVIELAFFIEAKGEGNARTKEICNWIAALGRMPTPSEFTAFLTAHGVNLTDMGGKVENHEN